MKVNNGLHLIFYFTCFVCVALFLTHPVQVLPIDASNFDVRNHFGFSDQGNFALGGWTIFTKGGLDSYTLPLITLWPPGFMVLQAAILKIFGANAPLILIVQILAAFTLAVACNLFRLRLGVFLNKYYATLIPLLLLTSTQFRNFMLGQAGVLLGETFAISFLLIGFFCILSACANKKIHLAIIAGIAFALSAYFRSQFETFFAIGTLNFLLIFGLLQIYRKFRKIGPQSKFYPLTTSTKANPIFIIFIALLAFHLCTIPYRIYHHERVGSLKWVQTVSVIWQANLLNTLNAADTGTNIVCLLNHDLCQLGDHLDKIPPRVARYYVISTFLSHPFQWLYLKYRLLPKFWFGAFYNDAYALSYPAPPTVHSYIENSLFLLCFIFSLAVMFYLIEDVNFLINYWLSTSLILAHFLIFLLARFETRYLYLFKIYFFVSAMLYLAQIIARRRDKADVKDMAV